jgi:hypothetical protein
MMSKLNEYKEREKEQKKLKKDISKSTNKIRALETDITKIRA